MQSESLGRLILKLIEAQDLFLLVRLALVVSLLSLLPACSEPEEKKIGDKASSPAVSEKGALSNFSHSAWSGLFNDDAALPSGSEVSEAALRRNFLVVLDGSGSMSERACGSSLTKYKSAKDALSYFIKALNSDDNLGLVAFDSSGTNVRLPLNHGMQHHKEFVGKVSQVKSDSDTPLGQAISVAFEALKQQAGRQMGYGEYHMVVVTDGVASDPVLMRSVVNNVLRDSPVVLTTFGFCIHNEHALNQPGQTIYKEARNTEDLVQGLEAVAAEAASFQDMTSFQ